MDDYEMYEREPVGCGCTVPCRWSPDGQHHVITRSDPADLFDWVECMYCGQAS